MLMQEALKLKNDKYASLAAYYHLLYYYNRCEQDSVAKWIVKMEPLVQKSGLWDYFFDARRFQIDLYTFTEQYELAISEANKMKQKALDNVVQGREACGVMRQRLQHLQQTV